MEFSKFKEMPKEDEDKIRKSETLPILDNSFGIV